MNISPVSARIKIGLSHDRLRLFVSSLLTPFVIPASHSPIQTRNIYTDFVKFSEEYDKVLATKAFR